MDNFDFVEAFSSNDSIGKSVATTLKDSSVKTCFVCIPQLLIHVAKDTIEPIVDACKEAGVVRIIKVGSFEPEKCEYGRKHLQAEQYIHDQGLKLTVVRAGSLSSKPDFWGPGPPGAPYFLYDIFSSMSYLSRIGLGIFRTMGSCASFIGDEKLPFVDTRDYADAVLEVLLAPEAHDDKTYTIISEPHIDIKTVASVYSELIGRKISVTYVEDEDEIRAIFKMAAFGPEMTDLTVEMLTRFREGGVADIESDDFGKLTGGKVPLTLANFAAENVSKVGRPPKLWW
jgi:uncharacterized protein YbjT (DUF2867 family)